MNIKMAKKKDMEFTLEIMEINMKGNIKRERKMEKEKYFIMIILILKGISKRGKKKDLGYANIIMEEYIKENIKMIKKMDME